MSLPEGLLRKIGKLRQDPVGSVTRRVRSSFDRRSRELRRWHRETYGFRFSRPQYDIWRYFLNRESVRLYKAAKDGMHASPAVEKVIREVEDRGIAVVRFEDVFPGIRFTEIQAAAEESTRKQPYKEIIEAMEAGADYEAANTLAQAGKHYLVPLWGNIPALDLGDPFTQIAISPEMLALTAGYFRMLPRLTYANLWLNMPTPGPSVKSQRWHRDPEDRKIMRVFLYLRDVDETSGPFCFMPETHNGGRYGRVFRQGIDRYNYPPDGAVEKTLPIEPRICTGPAGTLVFVDTSGFHRGGHVLARPRLLFHLAYTTSGSSWVILNRSFYSVAGNGSGLSVPAKYALKGHLNAAV